MNHPPWTYPTVQTIPVDVVDNGNDVNAVDVVDSVNAADNVAVVFGGNRLNVVTTTGVGRGDRMRLKFLATTVTGHGAQTTPAQGYKFTICRERIGKGYKSLKC